MVLVVGKEGWFGDGGSFRRDTFYGYVGRIVRFIWWDMVVRSDGYEDNGFYGYSKKNGFVFKWFCRIIIQVDGGIGSIQVIIGQYCDKGDLLK